MSQAELAKHVGLSSAAIWNWETKGRVPRPRTLAKVAEALNVSEQFLAEGHDRPGLSHSGTTKEIELAAKGAPAHGTEQGVATLAEVVERTRKRIAELTGFGPDQLKLTLTIDGLDSTAAINRGAKNEKHP
jgi:transcriptional regulator with XRE-family HTH domain